MRKTGVRWWVLTVSALAVLSTGCGRNVNVQIGMPGLTAGFSGLGNASFSGGQSLGGPIGANPGDPSAYLLPSGKNTMVNPVAARFIPGGWFDPNCAPGSVAGAPSAPVPSVHSTPAPQVAYQPSFQPSYQPAFQPAQPDPSAFGGGVDPMAVAPQPDPSMQPTEPGILGVPTQQDPAVADPSLAPAGPKFGGEPVPSTVPQGIPGTENLQASAKDVAQWPSFPYAEETEGGRLGCAQVGSAILRNAHEIEGEFLSVQGLCDHLRSRGWVNVPLTNLAPGDCVVWNTPEKRHFGVCVENEGRLCVVQNSSDLRRPVMVPVDEYPYPLKEVLQKSTGTLADASM